MLLRQIVPQGVDAAIPAAADQQQIFALQILCGQLVFGREAVMNGYGAAQRRLGQWKDAAGVPLQKSGIVNTGDDIDVLAEVFLDLAGVLRRIFERNELQLDFRAMRVHLRP